MIYFGIWTGQISLYTSEFPGVQFYLRAELGNHKLDSQQWNWSNAFFSLLSNKDLRRDVKA